MRFASIGSGSQGNGTVISQANTHLLVDCGFSVGKAEKRLGKIGMRAEDLTAILVTHEHGDHIGGVAALAQKYQLPVYATGGTAGHLSSLDGTGLIEVFSSHSKFTIDDIDVMPFPVPHDAREPSQFVFSNGATRLGLLTDAGMITPAIERALSGCDALLLEANYDDDKLKKGDYPDWLKRRISGKLGHLSNAQSATLLKKIDVSRLQHIVAMHLSEKNNAPDIVTALFAHALGCDESEIGIAEQNAGFAWREIR